MLTESADGTRDDDYVSFNVPKGRYLMYIRVIKASNPYYGKRINFIASNSNGDNRNIFLGDYGSHFYMMGVDSGSKKAFKVDMPKGKTYLRITGDQYPASTGNFTIQLVRVPGKAGALKLKKAKKHSLKLTCTNVKYRTGYQVRYKKSGAKKWTTKNFKKNTFTLTKLKKNKKYKVKVRVYKTVNGKKFYGKWSKVKTVKTKRK